MKKLVLLIVLLISWSINYGQGNTETVTDVEGNVYKTVKIGTQTWMAENLKVTRLSSGEALSEVQNKDLWEMYNYAGYCWYNNDVFFKNTYGALYNFIGIDLQNKPEYGKRLTPKGWHVPSDEEWQVLINYLGGEKIAAAKMKEAGTDHWTTTNAETKNESGFTALPGGYRTNIMGIVKYMSVGEYAMFWSSTKKDGKHVWSYWIKKDTNEILKFPWSKYCGLSIRCVKD